MNPAKFYTQKATSKLIGKKVICTERPNEIGVITYKNDFTDDLDIEYPNGEIVIAHMSKCSCRV